MVNLFAHAVQYALCPFRRPRFNDLLGNRRHDHSQGARQVSRHVYGPASPLKPGVVEGVETPPGSCPQVCGFASVALRATEMRSLKYCNTDFDNRSAERLAGTQW